MFAIAPMMYGFSILFETLFLFLSMVDCSENQPNATFVDTGVPEDYTCTFSWPWASLSLPREIGELILILLIFALLLVTMGALLIPLHYLVLVEFRRSSNYCSFVLQHMSIVLRSATRDAELLGNHKKLAEYLVDWMDARIFLQRNDINFYFSSISGVIGSLALCALSCSLLILMQLFRIAEFHIVYLVLLAISCLWFTSIAYTQAFEVLKMDACKVEQLRVLGYLRLVLYQQAVGVEFQAEPPAPGSSPKIIQVVDHVAVYLSEHLEAPTVLGVAVDPALISLLNRSVAGVLGTGLISIVSSSLHD
jgi:hypothetical protein